MLGKTGVVAGGLIPVALEVVVFRKSSKLGLYALVSAVVGVLSAVASSSQLDNEPASQGLVVVVPALWTLSSGILVPVWSGNAALLFSFPACYLSFYLIHFSSHCIHGLECSNQLLSPLIQFSL